MQADQQFKHINANGSSYRKAFIIASIVSASVLGYMLWLGEYALAGLFMFSILVWLYTSRQVIGSQQTQIDSPGAVDEIHVAVHKQLRYLQDELHYLGQISTDASTRIMQGFNRLQQHVRWQEQKFRDSVASAAGTAEENHQQSLNAGQSSSVQETADITMLVNADINAIVQALQYEDILQQMIERLVHRIGALDDVMSDVSQVLSHCASAQSAAYRSKVLDSLQNMDTTSLNRVNDISQNWTDNNPPTNKVELF